MKALEYIKARLAERSTWAGIGVGITGASALVSPWSYVAVAVAVIMMLVPNKGVDV